jgi:hypothetical protein
MSSFENKKIEIKIRDENNEVLYQKKIDEVGNIKKRFNIAALHAGSYTAEIITNHYNYQQKFIVGQEHSLNLNTSDKSQNKTIKKGQTGIDTQKNKYPYINSRIKWLNNLENRR